MKEPMYLHLTKGPIPLSQCSPPELMEVVSGETEFVPDETDTDELFGRQYAAQLLKEKLSV